MAVEQVNFFEMVGPADQIEDFNNIVRDHCEMMLETNWFDVRKWDVHQTNDLSAEGMTYNLIEFEATDDLPIIKTLPNGQKWLQMRFITRDSTMNETFLKALSQKFQALVLLGFYNWEMMQELTVRLAHGDYYDENERDFDTDEERFEELEENDADEAEFNQWSEEMSSAIETQIEFEKAALLEEYERHHPAPFHYPKISDCIKNPTKTR